jgi:hypothetical protein
VTQRCPHCQCKIESGYHERGCPEREAKRSPPRASESMFASDLLVVLDGAVLGRRHLLDGRTDAEQFQKLLQCTLATLNMSAAVFAERIGISTPSAERWLNGATAPHVALRPALYGWMRAEVEKHVRSIRLR